MNVLIAIIRLLLGLSDEPARPPPPRRRLRPPAPAARRPESAPEPEPASLEDMFRRLFEEAGADGGEADGAGVPARPEPEAPAGLESGPPARRPEEAAPRLRPDPAPLPKAEPAVPEPVSIPSPLPAPAAAASYLAAARPRAGKPDASAQALALRLRGNPGAAREAFIHAEIFGRPLAERPGGRG